MDDFGVRLSNVKGLIGISELVLGAVVAGIVLIYLFIADKAAFQEEFPVQLAELAGLFLVGLFLWTRALLRMKPDLEPKRRNFLASAFALAASSAFGFGWAVKPSRAAMSASEELAGDYVRGRVFRAVDLVGITTVVREKIFEDCTFFGPAMFWLTGLGSITHCHFDAEKAEDIVYALEARSGKVAGVIRMEGCHFRRCRFIGIGFVTPPSVFERVLEQFRAGSD